jgi:hypothetical protein
LLFWILRRRRSFSGTWCLTLSAEIVCFN